MRAVTFYIGYALGIQVVGLLQGKIKKLSKISTLQSEQNISSLLELEALATSDPRALRLGNTFSL